MLGKIVLEVQNIVKTYGDKSHSLTVLNGISAKIPAGSYCSLTGASGSGKTTLMNIIGLIDRATSGNVIIDGRHTETFEDDEAANFRNKTIGFVFQAFHLLPFMTAIDNVGLPLTYRGLTRKERREEAKYWLSMVGLENRLEHRPDELSGGQKQRVAIARALITNPKILLADEPTGNLDSLSAAEIISIFEKLNRELKMTILIVTHDATIAKNCHSQIILKDGAIIDQIGLP